MGLVFTPSTPIPPDAAGVADAYWYAVWNTPIRVPNDLQIGDTIYLADPHTGTLVWETEVTETLAVPYESTGVLRDHLIRKWGVHASPIVGDGPSPGFTIAWREVAAARLDRPVPDGHDPLEQWTHTHCLTRVERVAWRFRDEESCPLCLDRGSS